MFGHPERDTWTVRAAMGRDPDDPKGFRERVVAEEEGGKACETRFRVVQRGVLTLEGKYKVGRCASRARFLLTRGLKGVRFQIVKNDLIHTICVSSMPFEFNPVPLQQGCAGE